MTSGRMPVEPDSSFVGMNLRYAADRGSRIGRGTVRRVRLTVPDNPHVDTYEDLQYASDRRALVDPPPSVAQVLLRPTSTFEPDYDEDPADAARARRLDPIDVDVYPNVQIGERYRRSLPVAERFLQYRAEGIAWYDAIVLLAVEFDFDDEKDVTDLLAWMGIEQAMTTTKAARSGRNGIAIVHGQLQTYNRLGCRCQRCRLAMENHREAIGLARRIPAGPTRRTRKPKATKPIPHGTPNGYTNYGCRCDACRKAASEYHKAQRLRRKAAERDAERLQALRPRP